MLKTNAEIDGGTKIDAAGYYVKLPLYDD